MRTVYLLIALGLFISCKSNFINSNNDNAMEMYNFELMNKIKESGQLSTVVEKGNSLVFMTCMYESGAFYKEYLPSPAYYHVVKEFYPNGILKHKGNYIQNVKIGIWQYYDEKGCLLKEEDEDRKFGLIKIEWILKFIEKEGWIDLKTGRGREEIAYTSSNRGYIKNGIFLLAFIRKGEDPHKKYMDFPFWEITILDCPETGFIETVYEIHGNTGDLLSKESKQIFRKE